MTSCWCSIVTMALSRIVSEILDVEKYRELEIPVKGQSRSFKVGPFEDNIVRMLRYNSVNNDCSERGL